MDIRLAVHNIGFLISIVAGIAIFLFLLINRRSKASSLLQLAAIAAVTFFVSHLIGTNTINSEFSKEALMFNLSNFFMGLFTGHAVLVYLGKERERRHTFAIASLYAIAFGFTILFIAKPELFLLTSSPKMYFPNYYVPGILNWTRLVFLYGLCLPYQLFLLAESYFKKDKNDVAERKQLKFFILAILIGFGTGFIPNFLVYGIPVDPALGTLSMFLFTIPFVYGAVNYGLLDIKIIAKQAFWYSLAVVGTGSLIMIFNSSGSIIQSAYPAFPTWVIPLISGIIIVTIGIIIWRQMREGDILKYEFITTIAHKFRTPLTHIRWISDNLIRMVASEEQKDQIKNIQNANSKMIELVNLVVNVSENELWQQKYERGEVNLTNATKDALDNLSGFYSTKQLKINQSIASDIKIMADATRISFVLQTLIENAIDYTPRWGVINISLKKEKGWTIFSVKDTGIGINRDEMLFLFSKFYRGNKARLVDTEGVGVGLYISKKIIEGHGGKIWAESDGEGMGSTFYFSLPAIN